MKTANRFISITLCAVILALMCALPALDAMAAGSPAVLPAVTGEEQAGEILKILSAYSPAMMQMLDDEFSRKQGTVMQSGTGNTVNGVTIMYDREVKTVDDLILAWHTDGTNLISSLSIAVHENYHGYQDSDMVIRDGVGKITHIVNDRPFTIPYMPGGIIKTAEATSAISQDLRTFRWNTYVSPDSGLTSNLLGAYGLLDEISAYYYGGKAVNDAIPYLLDYLDKHGIEVEIGDYSFDLLRSCLNVFSNSTGAFYEFKYWTLEYLIFLQRNHPSAYREIMGNQAYIDAFVHFNDKYEDLIGRLIPDSIESLKKKLTAMGVSFSEDGEVYIVNRFRIGKLNEDGNKLIREMQSERHRVMLGNIFASAAPSPAPGPVPPAQLTVSPTPSTVYVNGVAMAFEAYLIGGNNYFKLRDLAYVINGTGKQFEVGYDDETRAITLTGGEPYTADGGEMRQGDGAAKQASHNAGINISKDGGPVDITAYLIAGNNFMRLRDLMRLLDIYVGYDTATRNIFIDTSRPYAEE